MSNSSESEWQTRKKRIDPRLKALGWDVVPFDKAGSPYHGKALEEYPTDNGPADYALFLNGIVYGVIEAKKLTIGPQNVLTQAERYARGVSGSPFSYSGGYRVPFLYSTNGEMIWFHDVRHPLNRSRKVVDFHTPDALLEMMGRDFVQECAWLAAHPSDHAWLRPYQRDAHAAVENAIRARKRQIAEGADLMLHMDDGPIIECRPGLIVGFRVGDAAALQRGQPA